jgi:hypothetical protein
MLRIRLAALIALGLLGGCSSVDFSRLPPGAFTGSLFVMWVGEGDGSSGDGKFLYVPDPQDPLTFQRRDPGLPGAKIKPGLMYTDGGSIPKIGQLFKGLSPWGYAPAYMVHDWMFVAHHCIVDGQDSPRFDQVRAVDFENSAEILGEAIQALIAERKVQPNDLAGTVITGAVDSAIAKNLWDARGACAASQVTAQDAAAAEAAIPGSTKAAVRRTFRLPEAAPQGPSRRPARVVAKVTF